MPIITCILSARYQRVVIGVVSFCYYTRRLGLTAPLPFRLWLAFPEIGVLTCYQEGMVRGFLLKHFTPRFSDDLVISELVRGFWHDQLLLNNWIQSILPYGSWYYTVALDLNTLVEVR